eukprot:NODE_1026_length_2550_cov_0.248062.p1 type:complete len:502 gc:universal NODE_1026_length_2550_cov_0.248062:2314-809(-)
MEHNDKSNGQKVPVNRHKLYIYISLLLLLTIYIITAVIKKGWDATGLCIFYIWVTYKLLCICFNYSNHYSFPVVSLNSKMLFGMFVVYILILFGFSLSNTDPLLRLRSLGGLVVLLGLFYITSRSRKSINFRTVVCGLYLQLILALFVLKTFIGRTFFINLAGIVTSFMEFSKAGLEFVFGKEVAEAKIFAVSVFPAVIFFASFIQVLYYLGAMQYVVKHVAKLMVFVMDTSGSESIVAAASPFVGQGESALLVKPFVEFMTLSELHAVMVSGFAAVAGSVLIAFMSFGIDSVSLLTGSVMAAPCSLVFSKLRLPETETSITKGKVQLPKMEKQANILDAAGEGAITGVKIAGVIAGTIIAFISIFALLNQLTSYFCAFIVDRTITIQILLSYLFQPFSFLMGVPFDQIPFVSELLGLKLVVNEFAAYIQLSQATVDTRTNLLATYALCGFANVSSIGITIGTIGSIAPTRQHELAKIGVSAMLTGACCTIINACIAGILI